ncbi:MAG TPA: aminopeptidase P N-terminal domain-containing protein, partial [Segetibacter sp.]
MTKNVIVALVALLMASGNNFSQPAGEYPTDYLSKEFHAGRRAAFINKMPPNTVGIFFAAQQRTRSNDVTFQYAQNKNFYYLTGLEEPNALLLLFKQPVTMLNKTGTEFLFVQPKDPLREMWTGKILGPEGVQQKYGIENVFTYQVFKPSLINWPAIDSVFSQYRGEQILSQFNNAPDPLSTMAAGIDNTITSTKKPISTTGVWQILTDLRKIKQAEEIRLLEKAVSISVEAHNEVMKALKPGMTEYQAQAVMEYYFKKNGSEYPGYPSINGAAENGCVLHYVTNQKTMNNGELLLSDCAAEYHGYTADVTRTIPVNGKFSP